MGISIMLICVSSTLDCLVPTTVTASISLEARASSWFMAVSRRILPVQFDAAFIADSPLSWICRNNSKPGRPGSETWILHASPEWSKSNLEAPADFVLDHLLTEFEKFTTISNSDILYKSAHRWRYALAGANTKTDSLWEASIRLGICGDWLAGAKIEGAYISGLTLAAKILQQHN